MASLSVKDFYDLRFLGNLNIANGRVFVEIFRPKEADNKYESEINELRGSKILKYTRGNSDRDAVIDRTGIQMAYLVKDEKKVSILIKDIGTGEEREIWDTEMKIKKMKWDSGSRGLYIIAQEKRKEEDFKIIEKYPIYFNGEGFFPSTDFQFLHVSLSGKVSKLFTSDGSLSDFAVNPAKEEIAIVTNPDGWDVYDDTIDILSPKSKKLQRLKGVKGGISDPNYDEDGRLYFLFSKHEKSVFESPKIYCYENGKFNVLLEKTDISPENSVNSDSRMGIRTSFRVRGKHVYFVATVGGRAGIYRTGEGGKVEGVVTGNMSVDTFDFLGDTIFFIAQSSNSPQEVYSFDGKVKRITSINSKIEKKSLGKVVNFKTKMSDGEEVEGWFMKGRNRGTIMEIHGGPRTSYGEGFVFEFHLLNASGFNVLFSNPRGSDSYGDNFALQIKEKYGERDYKDILEVVDYCAKRFGMNKGKMGVIGGSYGGFMVNWIIGHTDLFKAAVTARSISDQVSFYFSSDIGPRFNSDQMGGNPYDNLQQYWNKSPIKYATKIKTPLLIVHSEEDYRCPIWQAYELFTQLKQQGSEVKMITFKGENHDLSRGGKPKNRVKRLEEIRNWFEEKLA